MQYITITSKHHDGFAMFDSKVSDYDIVDRTPYKKDLLKALADECRKQGIKLFFYYSQLDWHHPDYFPRGRTGATPERPETGDWTRYLDYMDAQLRELLTNYGEIGGIWFDGWWDKAGRGLAARAHLRADPPAAAGGARRQQPSPVAVPGRGLPDVREGPAGRQHRRVQHGLARSATCRSRPARRSTARGASTSPTGVTRARRSSCTTWCARPAPTPTSC